MSKGLPAKSTWTEKLSTRFGQRHASSVRWLPVVLSPYDGQFIEAFLMCVLIENLVFIPLSLISMELLKVVLSSISERRRLSRVVLVAIRLS
ncbi:hypothetical protein OH492_13505 [Vibrio chagasii]|nr:hypothetical protein [Vibrio chagasii]